ncbi:MAG: hypothetical protein NTU41_06155 [Chloroflexi bacterium]|nr:hypothetical protein [Chloroflexota bacterium]
MGRFRDENVHELEKKEIYTLPAFAKKKAFLSETQLRRVIADRTHWSDYGIWGARKIGSAWVIAASRAAWDELSSLASEGQAPSGANQMETGSSDAPLPTVPDMGSFFVFGEPFMSISVGEAPSGRFVDAPFCANVEIERLLRSGERDAKTIYERAIARYDEEIEYWNWHFDEESCGGVPVSEDAACMLVGVLTHNRHALRYYRFGGQALPCPIPDWPGTDTPEAARPHGNVESSPV